jgi:hypothetical protein
VEKKRIKTNYKKNQILNDEIEKENNFRKRPKKN